MKHPGNQNVPIPSPFRINAAFIDIRFENANICISVMNSSIFSFFWESFYDILSKTIFEKINLNFQNLKNKTFINRLFTLMNEFFRLLPVQLA